MKIDWHSNFMTPVFPSFNTFKRCSFYIIEIFWYIEDTNGKLGKSCRICFINITSPTSPYSTKSCAVSHIKHTAKFMLNFMRSKIWLTSCTGKAIVWKTSSPHQCSTCLVVIRSLNSNLCCLADCNEKSFCDTVDQVNILCICEVTLHCVHHNIRSSTCCLVNRKCICKFWVHACKQWACTIMVIRAFQILLTFVFFNCNYHRITRFRSCCSNCRNTANRCNFICFYFSHE